MQSIKKKPGEKVTVLAYADDVTLIAANKAQASEMLRDLYKALQGINLELLAENAAPCGQKLRKDQSQKR